MILKIRKIFEQFVLDIFMTLKTASRISSVSRVFYCRVGGQGFDSQGQINSRVLT